MTAADSFSSSASVASSSLLSSSYPSSAASAPPRTPTTNDEGAEDSGAREAGERGFGERELSDDLQDEQSEVALGFVPSEEVGERRRRRVDGYEVAARLGRCEAVERRARVLDERRVVAAGGHRLRRRGEWKRERGLGGGGRRGRRKGLGAPARAR